MLRSYDKWHWRAVNIASRIFGLLALINGTIIAASGVLLLLRPQSGVDAEDIPAAAGPKFAMIAGGAVAIALGILFVRARTFRPDLGDASWLVEPQVAKAQQRSGRNWWTGDRKDGSAKAAV